MMDSEELKRSWIAEQERGFSGWDFSYLRGRMAVDPRPWSYRGRAEKVMASARSLLDLDTGGGERLAEMRGSWPEVVVATEAYRPNVPIARERLEKLGGTLVETSCEDGHRFPFEDESFDVVLNRHGSINASEIVRCLRPGGTFLTEQVHRDWAVDLVLAMGGEPELSDSTLEARAERLERAGLVVVESESRDGTLRFSDVGAVVYYLRAIPSMVEGFSVESHFDRLLELERLIESDGELSFVAKEFLLIARKPEL